MERFGPFELVLRLGAGGMARTHLARRTTPHGVVQHVCLKRLFDWTAQDPAQRAELLDEAKLVGRLRHRNIVQLVDAGEIDGVPYLALELVDGMDLASLLALLRDRHIPLSIEAALHIGIELAHALEHAHTPEPASQTDEARGAVVHRDVTPSNILISRSGEVYLTDFGIAHMLDALRTMRSAPSGKTPYMAPEYASNPLCFDARTDLYMWGTIVYEMLAGRRAYDGASDFEILTRSAQGDHPPLAALRPDTPRPLVAIVKRAMQPDPSARFGSARALLDALAVFPSRPAVARHLGELVRAVRPSLRDSMRHLLDTTTTPHAEDFDKTDVSLPGFPNVGAGGLAYPDHLPQDAWLTTDPSPPRADMIPTTNPSWPAFDPAIAAASPSCSEPGLTATVVLPSAALPASAPHPFSQAATNLPVLALEPPITAPSPGLGARAFVLVALVALVLGATITALLLFLLR
ncbi:MAG: protein kinase [Sandaracinaceae bacterium]|nr:protein kinase [Sandaracinaceae bacterium]